MKVEIEIAELRDEVKRELPKVVRELIEPILLLPDAPDIMNVSDLSKVLNEPEKRIYDYCNRNEIPHVHLGKQVRFTRPQIIKFLNGDEWNRCDQCGVKKTKKSNVRPFKAMAERLVG